MSNREQQKPGRRNDDAAPMNEDELVDEMSDQSFPASDPPSTTPEHAGSPRPVGEDRQPGTNHEPRAR